MKTEKKKFKIKFTTKMLGTVPKDKEIYASYIATKAPGNKQDDIIDEINTVQEVEEKGWTGFHGDKNGLFIYSYMVLGFLKKALEVLMENGEVKKIPAYKKWIDSLVFVYPRRLYFGLDEPNGVKERPLRAMTAQGPRVTLSRSDYINEGREVEFEVEVLKNGKGINLKMIEKCFSYGKYQGLGQWRGSGRYGQFEVVK